MSFQEMNNLISKISPLTKAIIWLAPAPLNADSTSYKAVDYLLNGLLTSSLNAKDDLNSRLLLGDHFSDKLFVFITHNLNISDLHHFVALIEPVMTSENNVLLIDELNKFEELSKNLPTAIKNSLIKYQ